MKCSFQCLKTENQNSSLNRLNLFFSEESNKYELFLKFVHNF